MACSERANERLTLVNETKRLVSALSVEIKNYNDIFRLEVCAVC